MEWEGKHVQEDVVETLEEDFPNAIIRLFDDGVVSLSINAGDMADPTEVDGEEANPVDGRLNADGLPDGWHISDVFWGRGGVSIHIEREADPDE